MSDRAAIIGVDCATEPRKTGLAWGLYRNGGLELEEVGRGNHEMISKLVGWIDERERTLLALDAPLGWPLPMGPDLASHQAGEAIDTDPNHLFSRETDRRIRERFEEIRPFEVGADRIARTAHAALTLLATLRRETGCSIPLAWSPDFDHRVSAIEVYPSATLRARGLPNSGYKHGADARAVREEIRDGLAPEFASDLDRPQLLENADVFDACVCARAAADFLAGRGEAPQNVDRARKEGWIWVAENEFVDRH